jgi:chromatin remodeling complex protein RSC6
MTYWIQKENGQIICRSTVRPLPKEEWISETEKATRLSFDETIKEKYANFDPELLEVFENEDIINHLVWKRKNQKMTRSLK